MVEHLPSTVIAINILRRGHSDHHVNLSARPPAVVGIGAIATALVALVLHWLADPVPGVGIAVPIFIPAIVTAAVSLLLSRSDAAPLAYISPRNVHTPGRWRTFRAPFYASA